MFESFLSFEQRDLISLLFTFSGKLKAFVPSLGEYGNTWRYDILRALINEYVLLKLSFVSPGKPAMTSNPIDAFGIGTELVTGKNDAALDGVYKLTQINDSPKMKFSENIEKVTLPGEKKVVRYFDENGKFYRDAILLANENPEDIDIIYHPIYPQKNSPVKNLKKELLLQKVVIDGKVILQKKSPLEIHKYLEERAQLFPNEHKRFISPHLYKVGISKKLMETRNALTKKLKT